MKFNLVHNWSDVLKFAWSWRFAFLAALLGVGETIHQLATTGQPPVVVMIVGGLAFFAAVSRVIDQSNLATVSPADYSSLVLAYAATVKELADTQAKVAQKAQAEQVPSPATLRTMAAEGGALG